MKDSYYIKPQLDGSYPTALYGKGIYIHDDEGKSYLDGSSGAVTASIGHAVPEIIEVISKQAEKLSFVYRSQFTTREAEQLAEKLSMIPFIREKKFHSFFVNSGSEATETAMKISIQYWQEKGMPTKNKIISRWTSYHGITMGALSMSGHSERRNRFTSLLDELPSIHAPYCYRCPFNQEYPSCHSKCATELEEVILRLGANQIAAFISEPIVGAAGAVIIPPDDYYTIIEEICRKYDILFIADEVMTGMGRTGKMLAMEHWNNVPDMIVLGKGLSAGYTPLAATLVSEEILDVIRKGSNSIMSGHTYSGNPQSAATALAVFQYIEKHHLVQNAEAMGEYLLQELKKMQKDFPILGDIRGRGLLIGVEFVANLQRKIPFTKEIHITNLLVTTARREGLLIYPASAGVEGGDGDAVIIAPPLTIVKEEVDHLVQLFRRSLELVERIVFTQ